MNKYVRKLFGVVFQSQQTQQVVLASPQHSLTSPEEWRQHWQEKGFPWRTESEIDAKRQEELTKCCAIVPNIKKGIYPFNGMKLGRADIEWLIAKHKVDWTSLEEGEHEGLDLRGANLHGEDLRGLPLTRLRLEQTSADFDVATVEGNTYKMFTSLYDGLATMSFVLMDIADLSGAHLEGANLMHARMRGTILIDAHLEGASLQGAQLEGAYLVHARLEKSNLSGAQLNQADLAEADLKDAYLGNAHLSNATLNRADFQGANLCGATLEEAKLIHANLEGAKLSGASLRRSKLFEARLKGADLSRCHLEEAELIHANLEETNLSGAHLEKADLSESSLAGANLSEAYLDDTKLNHVNLVANSKQMGPQLIDIHWGNTSLSTVKWSQIKMLGDEYIARQEKNNGGKKGKIQLQGEYETPVRANRQLAISLQNQGMNEDAARFAYRAQTLQRKLFWKQKNFWGWFGSMTLALLAGYGYRMWRILVVYVIIVLLCAGAYYVLGIYYEPHLSILEAMLTSITAFHGRVFSEPFLRPGEPQLWVTAFEAVADLVIESVFIAMLTQKFFGK